MSMETIDISRELGGRVEKSEFPKLVHSVRAWNKAPEIADAGKDVFDKLVRITNRRENKDEWDLIIGVTESGEKFIYLGLWD